MLHLSISLSPACQAYRRPFLPIFLKQPSVFPSGPVDEHVNQGSEPAIRLLFVLIAGFGGISCVSVLMSVAFFSFKW